MSALAFDMPPVPSLPRRAIIVSVALHAAALLLLPGLARQAERQLPPIIATLRLLPASQPASQPAIATAVTVPSPQKPAQPVQPAPRPLRSAEPAAPAAVAVRNETPASREAAVPAAAPENAARNERSAPAPTVPVAAAPAPGPAMDSAALDDYGRALSELLARQQQYPRVAAMRGWEGEVRLRLKVARKGNLVAVQIVHSSGHEVLDQHAVQMVQGAALPTPPEGFGDREIQVVVPIHYKLQKPT